LVDLQGVAAAGVRLRVSLVRRDVPDFWASHFYEPAGAPPPWPAPVTTDGRGRFTVRGLGASGHATLDVQDARYARERLVLHPPPKEPPGGVPLSLAPARVLRGEVAYEGGRPAAGARVVVESENAEGQGLPPDPTHSLADARGHFAVVPFNRRAYTV